MKKLALIFCILIFSLPATAKTNLLRYGLQWGYSANFFEGHYYLYQAETVPHYLLPVDQTAGLSYSGNAYILLNLGFNLDDKSSLGIAAGYAGIYKDRKSFPILLSYNFYPATMHKDGHFLTADAGIGIPTTGGNPMAQVCIGVGHRWVLSEKVNLDIILSLRGVYDNPPIWDSYDKTYISSKYIRKNDAGYASLNIGIAINFQ